MTGGRGKFKAKRGGRRNFSSFPAQAADGSSSENEGSSSQSDTEQPSVVIAEEPQNSVKPDTEDSADELGDIKVQNLHIDDNNRMSRKEREALEKKKAQERYWKLHMEGKTDQAKADLARLAQVKKRREEEAKKKEAERLGINILTFSKRASKKENLISFKRREYLLLTTK